MKKLSREVFTDRVAAIANARRIFTPHLTKNISEAFEIYQEIIAEQERELRLTSLMAGNRPWRLMDDYERPKCPSCGKDLALREITLEIGKENKFGWQSEWVCEEDNCLFEHFSNRSVLFWVKQLDKMSRQGATNYSLEEIEKWP